MHSNFKSHEKGESCVIVVMVVVIRAGGSSLKRVEQFPLK